MTASKITKPTKNQLRRAKKKTEKQKQQTTAQETPEDTQQTAQDGLVPDSAKEQPQTEKPVKNENDGDLTMEGPKVSLDSSLNDTESENPLYSMYRNIMSKFTQEEGEGTAAEVSKRPEVYFDDDIDIPDEEANVAPKLSKKKRKELNKISVAELKSMTRKPEMVDWRDASSSDPRLLVKIKTYRNVVPVPAHWASKREYLSSKRGVEKPPFSLPTFIEETGITEMRDAALEKQEQQSLKQKQRERVQGKTGKLDIDYEKLYEAFFRFQTKPELTRYGEVYYEGKEYETNLRHLRAGELSDELKEALNIPPDAPPPWLINQQRFGPPPSYPALKIPGVNAPIPPGAMWGYHPGGYGKPPVDEYNRPLFGGDLFGVLQTQQTYQQGEPVEKDLWGELQPPEEESEEESDEDEEMEEEEEEEEGGNQYE